MSQADKEFQNLIKGMRKFPQNVQKNVMNGAIRASTVEIQKQAQENVPEKTGNLKDAIVTRKGRSKDKSVTKWYVGILYASEAKKEQSFNVAGVNVITKKDSNSVADGYYGSFIEYGTRHIQGTQFMAKAVESKAKSAVETARKYMWKRIPKEAVKIGQGR